MADDVSITFSAQIGQLISGIEQVKEAISGISAPVNQLASTFSGLAEAFGIAFSVSALKNFTDQMAELGTQIERSHDILGLSTTEVQQLGFVAKATGGDAQGLVHVMGLLQVNLEKAQTGVGPTANALKALGLSAKELAELPVDQQAIKLADAFNKYADGGRKAALANELVRGGAEALLPIFEKGGTGIKKLSDSAVEFGAILSSGTVRTLDTLSTRLTTAKSALTTFGAEMVALYSKELSGFADWLASTAAQFTKLSEAGLLNQYVTTALAGSYDILVANLQKAKTALADFFAPAAQYYADLATADAKIKALEDKRAADLNGMVDQATAAYKKLILAQNKANKPSAPSSAGPNKDAIGAALAEAQEQIKLADQVYQQQIEKLNSEFKLHQITESEKTAATLSAINQREDAQLTALNKEESVEGISATKYAEIENEKTQVIMKAIGDRQRAQDQALQEEVKQWQSILQPIESAFNSQLRSLLAGTESWGQAMKKIVGDLVIAFIEGMEKIAVEWVATQLALAVGGPVSLFANAAKSIQANVGVVYAGEVANLALPLGPAAPAAAADIAASVEATALGLSALDVGGYVTQTGLAVVHEGEVIPAAQVQTPYGGTGGGGASGVTHNWNISAVDGASVLRMFQQHAGLINRILGNNADLNPSVA